MDIVLNILKQLSATLSPTEFLMVLVVIAFTAFSAVKFVLKITGKKSGEFNLFGSSSQEASKVQIDIEKIKDDLMAITNAQSELLVKLTEILSSIKSSTEENTEIIREHATEMLVFKKDVEAQGQAAQKEIDAIINQLKLLDAHNAQISESLKDSLSRILSSNTNMLTQMEKADEFAKAFVPEFRSYHKELSKDITQLSKDVALMERTVQTQINNNNALKLR